MPQTSQRAPLRILLACARPLILKVEQFEAELSQDAGVHQQAAEAPLPGAPWLQPERAVRPLNRGSP